MGVFEALTDEGGMARWTTEMKMKHGWDEMEHGGDGDDAGFDV